MNKEELNKLNQEEEVQDNKKCENNEVSKEEKLREYEDLLGF